MEILGVLEEIITCDKYPNMVSDGYMIDYQAAKHNNLSLAHKLTSRKVDAEIVRKLRTSESSCRRLNKISDIQCRKLGYDYKRLIYYADIITTVDSKYVFYFQDKYPDCQFYTSAQKEHCVAVRQGKELVGAIMPLLFPF